MQNTNQKKTDKFILLFSPQPTAQGRRTVPLGLLAISSYLCQQGYNFKIFHSYDTVEYTSVLNNLDNIICIGITSMTGYQIYDGLKFAKLVRQKNPKVKIIWGGIHSTIKPIQTAKHPLVDIVVKGPGEEIFTELVKHIDKQQNYENIPGITYLKDNKIIDNPSALQKSINEYPTLPYNILGELIEKYIKLTQFAKRNLHYITSSGCPFKCRFCYLSNPSFQKNGMPTRLIEW